jgi:hypothetical protein
MCCMMTQKWETAGKASLYLFNEDHPVRRAAHKIAHSVVFQHISGALVLGSCVMLAIENPHDQIRKPVYTYVEACSLAFFVFEAFVEIVDATLFEYLRHFNNVMDVLVIVNMTLSLFGDLGAGVQVRFTSPDTVTMCRESRNVCLK